jgi:hypothetical protein
MIFVIALAMRLWHLDEFPAPVFDEVYFPKFAENYLDNISFYDVHPPLGKFLIAIGILVFGRNEIGYRIMPALFGALVPVLVVGLVYRLSYWRNFALLSGFLMLGEGLFLVESRYSLMNVFLVDFGLATQIFLLAGLERKGLYRILLFASSGFMLGATIAVKWNGLWFAFFLGSVGLLVWSLAGQYRRLWILTGVMLSGTLLGGLVWLQNQIVDRGFLPQSALFCLSPAWILLALSLLTLGGLVYRYPQFCSERFPRLGILGRIRDVQWWEIGVCFVFFSFLIYFVQWLPHLLQNPQEGLDIRQNLTPLTYWQSFVKANQSLLGGQTAGNLIVSDETPVHPYCSSSLRSLGNVLPGLKPLLNHRILAAGAWSWPLMARPVGYYFNNTGDIWRTVHAIGNPILWWFSTGSILWLSWRGVRSFQGIPAYLLLGYAMNYLPWFIVSRCVFIYHYMSALVFSVIALAWILIHLLTSISQIRQQIGLSLATAIFLSYLFFSPIWFGSPLTPNGFYARMWFRGVPVPLCFTPKQCQSQPLQIPAIPGFNWI